MPVYQEYIVAIAEELAKNEKFAQSVTKACSAQSVDWIHAQAYRIGCARRVQKIHEQFRQTVHTNFMRQDEWLDNDTRIVYEQYEGWDTTRFTKRAQAEQEIKWSGARATQQSYTISNEAYRLLQESDIRIFYGCYGNQLQQVIHQECIDLIERTAQISSASPMFAYRSTLACCIDAAQTYNRVGQTYSATAVADFCYTVLDYGKAVVEGARDGLVSVAQQALDNPLQTATSVTLSVAAGEYMLAYQLGKLVYGLLNLTVNAAINPEQAQKTWNVYIEPINGLIDALKNKELSLRDGIRAGTALAVHMKAQSMLAKGCEKFCSIAKSRALTCATQNSCIDNSDYSEFCGKRFLKVINQSTEHCPASCHGQYRKLQEVLRKEQFTSIVRLSQHGYQRLIERNFAPKDVWNLLHKYDYLRMQSDGAKVYVKQIQGTYSMITINHETSRLITALKTLKFKDLIALGKNHGWTI